MTYWQEVTEIHRDGDKVSQPGSVLVFPFTDAGGLLWVRHPVRGWEVPGGKLERGETALQAVQREVWEEAGAHLRNVHWVAEYAIHLSASVLSYKWVYFAEVEGMSQRPANSEIIEVCIAPPPTPQEVVKDETYSPILKDAVYRSLWPDISAHSRTNTEGSP